MSGPQYDDEHFDREVAAFSRDRNRYSNLAEYVCKLIRDHCGTGMVHTTEWRAKTVESFDKKCRKLDDDGQLRYPSPNEQLTDLAGVRVIVFLRDNVDIVCNEIGVLFNVVESEDVGDRVYRKGKFGYQSKHLLIRLGDDRKNLRENKLIKDLICEVQVRTLLQHAWAEMEHDIQYKSEIDVPLDLNKRFSALAGLLEIADREFASIQRDSEALRRAVKEDLVTDLTHEGLSLAQNIKGQAVSDNSALDARDLINKGLYDEAIELYSSKITNEPNSYTLYIGRARAKFLAGDKRGAILDLDSADDLSQDKNKTQRLREIIEKGDDPRNIVRAPKTLSRFSDERRMASDAVKCGDGVQAFDIYSKLEATGYSRPFSLLGKAISCVLERDLEGTRSFVEGLQIRPGTSMAVNLYALRVITDILASKDADESLSGLEKALSEMPQYDLSLSQLNDLRVGLEVKAFPEHEALSKLFGKLPSNEK
jgi:ppGpp synthetase/RelA/SpoT-type nucleotidyltranferase